MESTNNDEKIKKQFLIFSDHIFPFLKHNNFYILDCEENDSYNCIAASLGVFNKWIWPAYNNSLYSFDLLYSCFGFDVCDLNFDLEYGFEKIVLLGLDCENIKHAMLQLKDGTWLSKCGESFLIKCFEPNVLCGNKYGMPLRMYYKKRNDNHDLLLDR